MMILTNVIDYLRSKGTPPDERRGFLGLVKDVMHGRRSRPAAGMTNLALMYKSKHWGECALMAADLLIKKDDDAELWSYLGGALNNLEKFPPRGRRVYASGSD